MSAAAINLILDKVASKDKDFRYMATSDLLNELSKDAFSVDPELERKLCGVVATQLEDASGDISGLAVKCLGALVRRVGEPRALDLVAGLCDRLAAPAARKDAAARDIATIGLKTVIEAAGGPLAHSAAALISARMLEAAAAAAGPQQQQQQQAGSSKGGGGSKGGGSSSKGNGGGGGGSGADAASAELLCDALGVQAELLARFGGLLPEQHAAIVAALLPHLDDGRPAIRKRALQCVAALAPFLSDAELDGVAVRALNRLRGDGGGDGGESLKPDATRGYVQAVGALSRAAGYRFGRHLEAAVPLVIAAGEAAAEGDDELREGALQALESFVARSPGDARPFLDDVLRVALAALRYDPNYADDDGGAMDEDGGGGSDAGDDDDDEDEESDEPYSDDEDASWKVRRAAAKLLSAIVASYPDAVASIYRRAAGELVARFREREEGVKHDVFAAYCDLLRQVGAVSGHHQHQHQQQQQQQLQQQQSQQQSSQQQPGRGGGGAGAGGSSGDAVDADSPLGLLLADVPAVVRAAARQLGDKSPKTRAGAFGVLRALVGVAPRAVGDHIGALVPGILAACRDKSAASAGLKVEALSFLRAALDANAGGGGGAGAAVFRPHAAALGGGVFAAAGERYYKLAAEALRVCERLVGVVRPDPLAPIAPPELQAQVVPQMYACVSGRLASQDQDQEVKEAAIMCMARLVAACGDVLGPAEVAGVLKTLLERARNEITRLPAVRAWRVLAGSPLPLGLEQGLQPVMAELTSFLRKANRLLRQASLAALEALVLKHGAALDAASTSAVVAEAAPLVGDADLTLAAAAMRLFVALLAKQPGAAGDVADRVLPAALCLVRSPLLQGAALAELLALFPALAATGSPAAATDKLVAALLDEGRGRGGGGAGGGGGSFTGVGGFGGSAAAAAAAASAAAAAAAADGAGGRQAQHNVAQCVAVLVVAAGDAQVAKTVAELLAMLKSVDAASQRLALFCLGEVGRRADLSGTPAVEAAVSGALGSDAEDIRAAASLALGGVCCGALPHYLPALLQRIAGAGGQAKQQYLLLQALNEVIATAGARRARGGDGGGGLDAVQLRQVLELLAEASTGEEECRNVVAECFGRLALLHPQEVVARLREGLTSGSERTRGVAVGALKHVAVDRPHPVDELLKGCLLDFLRLMGDADRHVRKAAVVSLSAAVLHKPALVAGQGQALDELLPLLYAQTEVRPELVRTVDLGPFKHRIDDGLELRKAAFEALDIVLAALPHALQANSSAAFLAALESGLKDHADVKAPAHLMVAKLAASPGGAPAVLAQLDRLVDPLEKTLTTKLKSDAVKQEADRHEELLRSCLRAVDALARIPGAEACAPFGALYRRVLASPQLKERLLAVQAERAEAEGEAMMEA